MPSLSSSTSRRSSGQAAAKQIEERHGLVDILVNNAGILPEATAGETAGPVDVEMFKKTFDTNVFGAVTVIQVFLPLLRQSKAGRIVNVSTTMGSLSDQSNPSSPYYGVIAPAYTRSNALNAVTVSLAKLLKDTPIKINSIALDGCRRTSAERKTELRHP